MPESCQYVRISAQISHDFFFPNPQLALSEEGKVKLCDFRGSAWAKALLLISG